MGLGEGTDPEEGLVEQWEVHEAQGPVKIKPKAGGIRKVDLHGSHNRDPLEEGLENYRQKALEHQLFHPHGHPAEGDFDVGLAIIRHIHMDSHRVCR